MRRIMVLVSILGLLLPAALPAQSGKAVTWETLKFDDGAFPSHVTATIMGPQGGGWDFAYQRLRNGDMSGPNVVFGATISVKETIDECKAVAKGEVTFADRKATLYEGSTSYWGATKIWVFKDRLSDTDKELAVMLGGKKLASFKADVDKILASLKPNLKPAQK
jgi:hypothetical protein